MDKQLSQRLVRQAQENPEAFGVLFDLLYPKILNYTVRRVGDVAIAEDITAETFVKALRHITTFKWRDVAVDSWIYTIATNEIRMHFRKSYRTVSLDELYEQSGFEPEADYDITAELQTAQEALARHTSFEAAQRIIHTLPIAYQEVLILRYGEHKKVREIARIVGKQEGTVKSLLSRGLAKVRKELAEHTQPKLESRIIDSRGKQNSKTSGRI